MALPSSPLTLSAILFMVALVSSDGVIFHRDHAASASDQTCVPLRNHGTHSTVEVAVGTPGQTFSVVADTGSNALIVPSCICQKAGYCAMTDRCFTGTNRSSTFSLEGGADKPTGVVLSFGSGMVKAVIAHDNVRVGNLEHQMQDGLLLMTAHALRLPGAFEGILGLGPPIPEEEFVPTNSSKNIEDDDSLIPFNQIQKIMDGVMGGGDMADIINGMGGMPGSMGDDDFPSAFSPMSGFFNRIRNQSNESMHDVTGFLEQAKIEYFSMCFNDGSDGVLRMGSQPQRTKDSLASVGTAHWGLDFRGVTVGNQSMPLEFCQMTNLTEGQKTPCGAIPDSGTTAIMAPQGQALLLFETICDTWQRCADNYTALVRAGEAAKQAALDNYNIDPFDITVTEASKTDVLKMLLFDCEDWMNHSGAFDELPSLKFHVVGGNGTKQTLEIPGVSYIMQTNVEDVEHATDNSSLGLANLTGAKMNLTINKKVVCSPAIGEFEYDTEENGPVWILGTPFFYEYNVGYNMFEKTITFTSTKEEACGGCNDNMAFVSTGRHAHRTRQPRFAKGPGRMPSIDTTKRL